MTHTGLVSLDLAVNEQQCQEYWPFTLYVLKDLELSRVIVQPRGILCDSHRKYTVTEHYTQ